MTNEDYYKNIYRIKFALDALEEAYWDNENPTKEETEQYEKTRKILCDKLEKAYKA